MSVLGRTHRRVVVMRAADPEHLAAEHDPVEGHGVGRLLDSPDIGGEAGHDLSSYESYMGSAIAARMV